MRKHEYASLVVRIRHSVKQHIPSGATVAIVSRGDDELLKLDSCQTWHFPKNSEGIWSGHYPPDSDMAIAQLESARARGAQYFLLPRSAFWWLDHYAGLRRHLDAAYRAVIRCSDYILYHLTGVPAANLVDSRVDFLLQALEHQRQRELTSAKTITNLTDLAARLESRIAAHDQRIADLLATMPVLTGGIDQTRQAISDLAARDPA